MSHMNIVIFTFAENKEDAASRTQDIIDKLCEREPFDYGSIIEDSLQLVQCAKFGQKECEDCQKRFTCFTTGTSDVVIQAVARQKQEFHENLAKVKSYLKAKNEQQLYEDSMFGYYAHKLYRTGFDCWLYDPECEPIQTDEHLRNVLNKWNSKEYSNLNIYVAQADMHY